MLSPFSAFRQAAKEYVVSTTDIAPLDGLLALSMEHPPPMVPAGKEATDFVHACEAIQALLAQGLLAPHDRDLIEFCGSELLVKLRFD